MQLRVMIVGAGGIAPAHIEGLLEFPEQARITVVANRHPERARKLIETYELGARAVSDYREGLGEVDLVCICTPPESHCRIAQESFAADAHVLLEKPMARSLAECDLIIAAAQAHKKVLSVVAQSRFISSINRTMALIHSGRYGRILFAQVNSFWWRGPAYYTLAWRGLWEQEGGGCTMNHAVHHIDLLLWAKGMPVEVTSLMSNLAHTNSEEEDISLSILRYADGSLAQLTCSLLHHGEQQMLDFQLEKAGIRIPFEASVSTERPNGFPVADEQAQEELLAAYDRIPELRHEHHSGQIANLLKAIEEGTDVLSDGYSGRAAIELIMAIYRSATEHAPVSLPLSEDDPFYRQEGLLERVMRFFTKTESVASFDDTSITSFKGKY
ncbi:MAG: Gfo/Idh/MocA family oxidoreductase [Spirochaetia bacterium]|nr:Gfo/Idh/MocA family oxidoreductase [Spirochaetia bacterium]MCF7941597.1 Gfo/Idh/MocA family oxidoreductase [Spirochaetia bacterium]